MSYIINFYAKISRVNDVLCGQTLCHKNEKMVKYLVSKHVLVSFLSKTELYRFRTFRIKNSLSVALNVPWGFYSNISQFCIIILFIL